MTHYAIYGLSSRHQQATAVIESYAAKRPDSAVAMAAASRIVPAGGMIELVASLAMQAPRLYGPMFFDLAVIYCVTLEAFSQPTITGDAHSAQVGQSLSAEFSPDFVRDMLQDLVPELWRGAAVSLLPAVGRRIASGADNLLTTTLAWRLATMAVLYLLHGNAWVGDKSHTYSLARKIVGRPNRQIHGRVRLDDLPYHVPEVYWRMIDGLTADIQALRLADPTLTDDRVRAQLQNQGVRDDQIESALAEAR